MFGILGWLLFGGMAAVEGTKDMCYKSDEYEEAKRNQKPYFYDRKGNTFLTSNPRIQVGWKIQTSRGEKYFGDKYKRYFAIQRRVLYDVRNMNVVYIYPEYWDEGEHKKLTEDEVSEIFKCNARSVYWA